MREQESDRQDAQLLLSPLRGKSLHASAGTEYVALASAPPGADEDAGHESVPDDRHGQKTMKQQEVEEQVPSLRA